MASFSKKLMEHSEAMTDKISESESDTEHRYSHDWDVFWAIENQNADVLTSSCESMLRDSHQINIYFNGAPRWQVFTDNEVLKMKIPDASRDFPITPLRHAELIGWDEGVEILCGVGSRSPPPDRNPLLPHDDSD
jgi:hypothetical protein